MGEYQDRKGRTYDIPDASNEDVDETAVHDLDDEDARYGLE